MGQAVIHNTDCIEGLKSLADGSVDFVFADLPYNQTRQKWDKPVPIQPLWEQLHRV